MLLQLFEITIKRKSGKSKMQSYGERNDVLLGYALVSS